MKLSACIEPESPPSQHIRSCLSTLSSLLISCVNVRWKAVTSELSYPRCQQKAIFNCPGPYISELNLPNLSQSIHNLTTDFVGDVQLDHAHVRRAEHGVLVVNHGEVEFLTVLLMRINLLRVSLTKSTNVCLVGGERESFSSQAGSVTCDLTARP
jgi:hypothetical protein